MGDVDPELLEDLDSEQHEMARRVLIAEVRTVPARSDLAHVLSEERRDTALGLLVLDGLVLRRVELVGRAGVELVGSGDFVRPWDCSGEFASVPAHVAWRVYEPVRVAVVDDEVARALTRFPSALRRLMARLAARADTLALNLALAQLPRVDARLLVLFWHLADRFGRVDADGVVIPLRLSHQTLAELVFAQRQSVTRSLHALAGRGLVVRDGASRWVLRGRPPATAGALGIELDGAGAPLP